MGNRYTCKQTFEEWCVENNRQDILDLWDYDKNDKLPSEVASGTKTKYYFRCPNGIHESESRRLIGISENVNHNLLCLQCTGGSGGNIRKDLAGCVFGNLTVLYLDEERTKSKPGTYWICECNCGCKVSVEASKLKSGLRSSCMGKNRHIKEINELGKEEKKTDITRRLRSSGLYYNWKKAVAEKYNTACIVCGSTQNNEYHHIYPFASHPHDRFDPDNGICLCKIHHNASVPGSFHSEYGKVNNTPEQLEEYVNRKRQELGIDEYFDVYEYMNTLDSDNLEIDDMELDL